MNLRTKGITSSPAQSSPRNRVLPAVIVSLVVHGGVMALFAATIYLAPRYQPARYFVGDAQPGGLHISLLADAQPGDNAGNSTGGGGAAPDRTQESSIAAPARLHESPTPVMMHTINVIAVDEQFNRETDRFFAAARPTPVSIYSVVGGATGDAAGNGNGSGGDSGSALTGNGHGDGGGTGLGQSAYLKNPLPPYPRLARERGWQGTTVLRVMVLATGTAESVEVVQSSGFRVLDDAAVTSVRGWRFLPARRGESAVNSWVEVPVRFQLENS